MTIIDIICLHFTCSSSVLDRLNGLLEPNGTLKMHELGTAGEDGEIPEVKPHPSFRLFMSMDPKHGEISRAMRNRGVEIYVGERKDSGGGVDQSICGLIEDNTNALNEIHFDGRGFDDEEMTAMMSTVQLPPTIFQPLLKFWTLIGQSDESLRDINSFMKACQLVRCLLAQNKEWTYRECLSISLSVVFSKGCHDLKIKSVRLYFMISLS